MDIYAGNPQVTTTSHNTLILDAARFFSTTDNEGITKTRSHFLACRSFAEQHIEELFICSIPFLAQPQRALADQLLHVLISRQIYRSNFQQRSRLGLVVLRLIRQRSPVIDLAHLICRHEA